MELHIIATTLTRLASGVRGPQRRLLSPAVTACANSVKVERSILHQDLLRLWNSRQVRGDFSLQIDSTRSLGFHRFIGAARSPFLCALLTSSLREALRGTAQINSDIFLLTSASEDASKRSQVVSWVLKFIYTGELPRRFTGVEDFVELIELGSFFRLCDTHAFGDGEFMSNIAKRVSSFAKHHTAAQLTELLDVLAAALDAQKEAPILAFLHGSLKGDRSKQQE